MERYCKMCSGVYSRVMIEGCAVVNVHAMWLA